MESVIPRVGHASKRREKAQIKDKLDHIKIQGKSQVKRGRLQHVPVPWTVSKELQVYLQKEDDGVRPRENTVEGGWSQRLGWAEADRGAGLTWLWMEAQVAYRQKEPGDQAAVPEHPGIHSRGLSTGREEWDLKDRAQARGKRPR